MQHSKGFRHTIYGVTICSSWSYDKHSVYVNYNGWRFLNLKKHKGFSKKLLDKAAGVWYDMIVDRITLLEVETITITAAQIESAIEAAIKQVKDFDGSRDKLIKEVIDPLQAQLQKGIAAGLTCSEKRIKSKFRRLQKALSQTDSRALVFIDERPSERAMRLSMGG